MVAFLIGLGVIVGVIAIVSAFVWTLDWIVTNDLGEPISTTILIVAVVGVVVGVAEVFGSMILHPSHSPPSWAVILTVGSGLMAFFAIAFWDQFW